MRLPLPRLWRHPFHGSPERKPSGIPVAVVCDHGAVVSTGFPSPDAGWVPAAPAKWASGAYHLLSQIKGGRGEHPALPAMVALTLSATLVIFGSRLTLCGYMRAERARVREVPQRIRTGLLYAGELAGAGFLEVVPCLILSATGLQVPTVGLDGFLTIVQVLGVQISE